MANLKLDPQYGATLKIGGEVISDEAIIHVNGASAIAYVYSPDTGANEVVGRLTHVAGETEKHGKSGHVTITGVDPTTGEIETWLVSPGRPCQGC